MENIAKISIEIPKDSEVYKSAIDFSEKYGSFLPSMFGTPEKVIEHCISFGFNPYVLDNMETLSHMAESYIKTNIYPVYENTVKDYIT